MAISNNNNNINNIKFVNYKVKMIQLYNSNTIEIMCICLIKQIE